MTDKSNVDPITGKSELESLKEKADDIGVGYSPNIGVAKLRAKLAEKLEPKTSKAEVGNYKTNPIIRQKLVKEATKLIRVVLTCRNPNKKELRGEYFTFGNSVVPSITRFVPFDIETHVEQGILNTLPDRKFAKVTMRKNAEGVPYPFRSLVTEFGVEILKPLTEKELKALASDQTKRGAIDK